LDKEEILSSNFVGASLIVCVVGIICYSVLSDESWLIVAAFGFAMMLPLASMLDSTRHKKKMIGYAAAMFLLGAAGIYKAFATGEAFNIYVILFMLGFIAFQWVATFLNIKQSNV
jgi:hypothetical protein